MRLSDLFKNKHSTLLQEAEGENMQTSWGLSKDLYDKGEQQLYRIAQFVYHQLPKKFNQFAFTSVEFAKSSDDSIRASAIFYLLCCQKVAESNLMIEKETMLDLLNQALVDRNEKVRAKAIKGYSLIAS